jgi:hypothetical protein
MLHTFRNLAFSLLISIGQACVTNHAYAAEAVASSSAEDFISLELISAHASLGQDAALGSQLFKKMYINSYPGGRPTQGTFTDEDLKQIAAGFDRIRAEATPFIKGLPAPEAQALHQAYVRAFRAKLQNQELARFYGGKEVQDWAKRSSAFLLKALPLSSLVSVLRVLAPDKYRFPTQTEANVFELTSGGVTSATNIFYISEALDSDELSPLIPARFNLDKLRKEERSLREDASRIFGSAAEAKHLYLIQAALYAGDNAINTELNKLIQQQPGIAQRQRQLEILAARASYAANPYLTGACDRIKERLDPSTIESSGGKWEGVKDVKGNQIKPGSDEMQVLAQAHMKGCYVKRNAAIARTLLEQWGDAHHDTGKKAVASHCTLAQWYRFGVGGPKDEATAIRWEDRYTTETGGYICPNQLPLIDPTDPWRLM